MNSLIKFMPPKGEEWQTFDEHLDRMLDQKLNETVHHLLKCEDKSDAFYALVDEFYHFAIAIRPRVPNSQFVVCIGQVLEALIASVDDQCLIDQEALKVKSRFHRKLLVGQNSDEILSEISSWFGELKKTLQTKKYYRIDQFMDFYFRKQNPVYFNPYYRGELRRSENVIEIKLLLKNLNLYLQGEITFFEPKSSASEIELAAMKILIDVIKSDRVLLVDQVGVFLMYEPQLNQPTKQIICLTNF